MRARSRYSARRSRGFQILTMPWAGTRWRRIGCTSRSFQVRMKTCCKSRTCRSWRRSCARSSKHRPIDSRRNAPLRNDRNGGVVALPFPQQKIFVEEEVGGREVAQRVCFANVIDIDAAAFKVFARLAFRWAKIGFDEQFNERNALSIETRARDFF